MNSIALLSSYAITLATAALIPGPGMTGLMFKTLTKSTWHSLIMLMGLITGDLIFLLLAIFGIHWVNQLFAPEFISVLICVACLYLLYLAYCFWIANSTHSEPSPFVQPQHTDYLDGLLITLSNPKTISFYLALVPSIFGSTIIPTPMLLIILSMTILTLGAVGGLYIFSAIQMQQRIKQPQFQLFLRKFSALIMAGFALSLMSIEIFQFI